MSMDQTIAVASAFAGINVVLLTVLTVIWLRNYRTFRTPLILGLLAFDVAMAAENALAIYFFFSMGMLYSGDPGVQSAVVVLRGLQFVALVFLTWVTMQ